VELWMRPMIYGTSKQVVSKRKGSHAGTTLAGYPSQWLLKINYQGF